MIREDIINMAAQAGIDETVWVFNDEAIERFAALVAAAERKAIGDIILDYAERDDLSDSDESLLKHLFDLIRARGET